MITADIHGSYSTWLTIKELLNKGDSLAVAGDLFDTRYCGMGGSDFQPEKIRKELADLAHPLFYVYGNCDVPAFYPSRDFQMSVKFLGMNLFLHHGHNFSIDLPAETDIIIQGHTHLAALEKHRELIYLNPGSLALPRNRVYTYGILDPQQIRIIDIKTGKAIKSIALKPESNPDSL